MNCSPSQKHPKNVLRCPCGYARDRKVFLPPPEPPSMAKLAKVEARMADVLKELEELVANGPIDNVAMAMLLREQSQLQAIIDMACPFTLSFIKQMISDTGGLCLTWCPNGCLVPANGRCEHLMSRLQGTIYNLDTEEIKKVDLNDIVYREYKSWALILGLDVKALPYRSSATDHKSIPLFEKNESIINSSTHVNLNVSDSVIHESKSFAQPYIPEARHIKGSKYRSQIAERHGVTLSEPLIIHVERDAQISLRRDD